MAIDGETFRACLGRWATGVTVVTTRVGDKIHGMTVSDFSGASLSPPLVSVCANRGSTTTKMIAEAECFAVNVLAAGQEGLSNHFASSKTESNRFEGIAYSTGKTGSPLLEGVCVRLDCTLAATYDAGDHVIYLGEIQQADYNDAEPLLHVSGAYRSLAERS